jgi:hypothetical protein
MARGTGVFLMLAAACPLAIAAAGEVGGMQSKSRPPDWPTERVLLQDGPVYYGYIESEGDAWVNFIQVQIIPGRPVFLVIRPIERAKIAKMERLDKERRAALRQRIDAFINRARIEAARMEAVPLRSETRDGAPCYRYAGKWFALESTIDEAFTRRMIVRLEQVFTGFRQILPPRSEPRRPLQIAVFDAMTGYRARLGQLGIQIDNPACFVPSENLIAAGSNARQFAAELARIKAQHAQIEADLKNLRRNLPERLAALAKQMRADGVPPDQIAKTLHNEGHRCQEEIARKEAELLKVNRENERLFQSAAGRMLARLYHEAFHAYLENYVYPRASHDVPLWLDEGLAQVFESGLLDADSLRIDAPNRELLKRLKTDLAGKEPLSLRKLLSADQQAFLGADNGARYYACAWGLAYYLTFEKHALGGPAMNRYVGAAAKELAPVERFEQLVGTRFDKFEDGWRQYILALRGS